jgi:hypothetical protein
MLTSPGPCSASAKRGKCWFNALNSRGVWQFGFAGVIYCPSISLERIDR